MQKSAFVFTSAFWGYNEIISIRYFQFGGGVCAITIVIILIFVMVTLGYPAHLQNRAFSLTKNYG